MIRYRITLRSDKDAGEGDLRSGSVFPVKARTRVYWEVKIGEKSSPAHFLPPPPLGRVEWREKKEREGRVETIGWHLVRSLIIDCCTR